MSECENLNKCRFFELLQGSRLKDLTSELIAVYCRGPFITECHRKQSIEQGHTPARELSPAGVAFHL